MEVEDYIDYEEIDNETIREWLRGNVTPIFDRVMKENELTYTSELRCGKCGCMDGLRFRWEYVDDRELTRLTLCHDGWGLQIEDSIVSCDNCGIDKSYSEEDFLIVEDTDEVKYLRELLIDELMDKHGELVRESYINNLIEDIIMYAGFSHILQSMTIFGEQFDDEGDEIK